MKKNNTIILVLISLLMFSGCKDWLDINYRPNSPTDVPISMSFPTPELVIGTRVGGNLYNLGAFFAQYWEQAPQANQYNSLAKYRLQTDLLNIDYRELYLALNNLESVRSKSKASNEWGYYIAATTLRAYTFQLMVDLMDDTPYSAALNPSNAQPKYDKGVDVYKGILDELDEALKHQGDAFDLGTTDIIIENGDINQWIGFANALKLKILMRQSNVADVSAQVKELIAEGAFFSGDISLTGFADDLGRRNPWYETNKIGLSANNHVATVSFIQTMLANDDPRLDMLFTPGANGHKGSIPGGKGESAFAKDSTKYMSMPSIGVTQPVYLYSQAELQFFIAEAQLRFNNNVSAAKTAFNNAHAAAFAVWGVDGSSLYDTNGAYAFDGSLRKIGVQKWIMLAHINNIEAWIEMRRMQMPKYGTATASQIAADVNVYVPGNLIDPYVNDLGAGQYLNRLYYPERSTSVNPNAPKQKKLVDKMFWQN